MRIAIESVCRFVQKYSTRVYFELISLTISFYFQRENSSLQRIAIVHFSTNTERFSYRYKHLNMLQLLGLPNFMRMLFECNSVKGSFLKTFGKRVIFSWEISASNKLNFSLNGHLWFEGAFRSTQLDNELSFCDKCFFLRSNQAKTPWMDRLFILNFLAFVSQISKFSIHACVVNNEFMCQIKN